MVFNYLNIVIIYLPTALYYSILINYDEAPDP